MRVILLLIMVWWTAAVPTIAQSVLKDLAVENDAAVVEGFVPDRTQAEPFAKMPPNTWVKISPRPTAPPSPQMGYEGDCVWDSHRSRLMRYGGHNQGGGGEQNSELWLFDPVSARWSLTHPNVQPPGVCCAQQNLFDNVLGNYIRFPAFSHSHGWQWMREVYLNNTSVWTFDPDQVRWRNMRPFPTPYPQALRCASWDTDLQILVLFGGESSGEGTWIYDPRANTWTDRAPPKEPMFRSSGNMVYDSRHKRHVLFGTQYKDDPHTWAYDVRTNRWHDMKPPSMPPTKANDAVMAYDSVNEVVLAVIKQSEGEWESAVHTMSTWAYDLGKNRWTELFPEAEMDPSSDRCRDLIYARRWNIALLENRTNVLPGDEDGPRGGEQQIWAYRYGSPTRPELLNPPSELSAQSTAGSVVLKWKHSGENGGFASNRPTQYAIYRAVGDPVWSVDFQPLAVVSADKETFKDHNPPAEVCRYSIEATGENGKTSTRCQFATTQPPLVDRLVVSVLSANKVQLNWSPPANQRGLKYIVQRAPVEVYSDSQLKMLVSRTQPLKETSVGAIDRVGTFLTLTQSPVDGHQFVDTQVDLSNPQPIREEPIHDEVYIMDRHLSADGQPYRFAVYAYRVVAVNAMGVVGGPSPTRFTIPAPVESVFAREQGQACEMRWIPNQERGIRGYRVYRLDGRWDETDPVSRLTVDPVVKTMFRDPKAGGKTRRYHVIAVDTLGQEGHPSSPVWYRREWKTFYKPFDEEWHQ